jgi:EmrB/QacA subfamily drug resistance transporter
MDDLHFKVNIKLHFVVVIPDVVLSCTSNGAAPVWPIAIAADTGAGSRCDNPPIGNPTLALGHSSPTAPAAKVRRRRLVTAGCMMAIFMAAVEVTIVATAMPTIIAELGGARFFSWVFAAYLLTQAVTTPIYGRLADIHGRKRVFVAGSSLFLAGSVACGFTWSMASLVLFRIVQGLGAGCIQSVATTIVGDIYGPSERARVQGWLSGVWAFAAIVGPILGAFIVERLHWAFVFWINLPVGLVTIWLFCAFLDEPLQRREHQIDYPGALLLMLGVGSIMTIMIQGQGLSLAIVALLATAGFGALAWLAVQERHASEPIIPIALLRNKVVAVGNFGSLSIGALLMCVVGFLPTYLQAVMGRSAATAGFVIAMLSVAWCCGSIIAGRMTAKASYRWTGIAGAMALIGATALLIMLDPHDGVVEMIAGAVLIGVGMGVCNLVFLLVVQGSVGWSERGVATASTLFARTIGQTVGAGLAGAILNFGISRYAPDSSNVLDVLLDATRPQGPHGPQVARLVEAAASSFHDVYLVAALLAVITLATAFLLPAKSSARADQLE